MDSQKKNSGTIDTCIDMIVILKGTQAILKAKLPVHTNGLNSRFDSAPRGSLSLAAPCVYTDK